MIPLDVGFGQPGDDRRWRLEFAAAAAVVSLFFGLAETRASVYLPDGETGESVTLSDTLDAHAPVDAAVSKGGDITDYVVFTRDGERIFLSEGFSVLDIRAIDPTLDRHGRRVSTRVSLAISGVGMPTPPYDLDDGYNPARAEQPGKPRSDALAKMLSLYVNVIKTNAAGAVQGQASIQDRPVARSEADLALVDVLLGNSADEAIANAIAFIARPNVDAGGFVSFSIAGMGEFAIVTEQNNGAIGIVNLGTGRMFTVPGANGAVLTSGMDTYSWQPGEPAGAKERRTAPSRTIRVVLAIVGYVLDVVTSPLTVGAAVSVFVLWSLWRSRRGHA